MTGIEEPVRDRDAVFAVRIDIASGMELFAIFCFLLPRVRKPAHAD